MNFDKAIKNLNSTAWDLLLLRLPEFLLKKDSVDGVIDLSYVCTAEKKLSEIGNLFILEHLVRDTQFSFNLREVGVNFLWDKLPPRFETALKNEIIDWLDATFSKHYKERKNMKIKEIDTQKIKIELELELKQLLTC